MKHPKLRWAQLCVAATISVILSVAAEASPERVVVRSGDTVESLARKHRVTKGDIARANGIEIDSVLRQGRRLIIPDSPRTVIKPGTMRRRATLDADRVSVRRGPDEDYKRITLLDAGERVTATRRAGDWLQVTLADGENGWIRSDFVKLGKELPRPKPAVSNALPKQAKTTARPAIVRRKAAFPARVSHRRVMPMYPKAVDRKLALRSADREPALAQYETRVVEPRDLSTTQTATSLDTKVENAAPDRSSTRAARLSRVPRGESSGLIRTAFAYRGVPYRFGGTTRRGIDCSAFTGAVYRSHGVKLPRTAREQATRGQKVAFEDMQSGDLVFFHTTRAGISHVGIYIGDGKFVHSSSSGGGVRVDSITDGYYRKRFRGARRVKEFSID